MKKALVIVCAALLLTACGNGGSSKIQRWEYKTVEISSNYSFNGAYPSNLSLSEEDLDMLGEDGWELVGIYDVINTSYPNFGNSSYVTGIRTNTRTTSVQFVFKRPRGAGKAAEKNKEEKETDKAEADSAAAAKP